MKYIVKLPKILCLILLLYKHVKNVKYYNTNDLIKLANDLKPELVRTRKDKNDYKFLEDTNFGGLRGNFSTLLTLKGIIKKNNNYAPYYGLSGTDRLFNAVQKGDIIINTEECSAYTMQTSLRDLLVNEAKNLNIREQQAHINLFLKNNKDFILKRDSVNFPKLGVLKSSNNRYFLRILFNTFKDDNIVEFSMLNYLKGNKIKVININPLFVIPSYNNAWEKFYVINAKEILINTPLFIYFDKQKEKFFDSKGNVYEHFSLEEGVEKLSDQFGYVDERLAYNWDNVRENLVDNIETSPQTIKQAEFSVFVKNFLKWKEQFSILGKDVVDITESSSGGADVILKFSGGTVQKLELEHKWNNYILHKHYKDRAWENVWLYADEPWDFEKIIKIFSPYISQYESCIPKVFLCANKATKNKEAYMIDWQKLEYKAIEIND